MMLYIFWAVMLNPLTYLPRADLRAIEQHLESDDE